MENNHLKFANKISHIDQTDSTSLKRKREQKEKKSKKIKDKETNYPVPNVSLQDLTEPLPLPQCFIEGT